MRRFAVICGLLAAACGTRNTELFSRYHENGIAKPVIAVASMIDTTSFDAPWSISEELTSTIIGQISKKGSVFVHSREDYPFAESPFGQDLSWVKREFNDQEFVLFLELVEHENVPAKMKTAPKGVAPQELSTNLNMAVRVRVVDLRGQSPKIVLQELVRESYYIPKSLLPTDYAQAVWGTEEYRQSPMGIAHAQIADAIVARVNDYVMLAKSR